jgi:hypothetical protein
MSQSAWVVKLLQPSPLQRRRKTMYIKKVGMGTHPQEVQGK